MKVIIGCVVAFILAFIAVAVGKLLFELGVAIALIAVCVLVGSILRMVYSHDRWHDS